MNNINIYFYYFFCIGLLIELNIIESTCIDLLFALSTNTTGINWRRELLNIIITQKFVYNYNGGHRRTFEGHAGTDAASAGTDALARRAPQRAGSEQRRTPQAAT